MGQRAARPLCMWHDKVREGLGLLGKKPWRLKENANTLKEGKRGNREGTDEGKLTRTCARSCRKKSKRQKINR